MEESLTRRLTLALLEEHTVEERGYDPYDTLTVQARDIWRLKRKRA